MALLKRRMHGESEIPTASLPDIVFMLLIFFLVTTTINVDTGIPMQLPDRGGEFKVNPENISNVLINTQGQILIDDELTDLTQVQEVMVTKVDSRGLDADGKPKLIVSIKTEKQTKYNDFIQVLDAIKAAGATKISIAEPEK